MDFVDLCGLGELAYLGVASGGILQVARNLEFQRVLEFNICNSVKVVNKVFGDIFEYGNIQSVSQELDRAME